MISTHLSTLADSIRVQQFALLCTGKDPFRKCQVRKDRDGSRWACAKLQRFLFAMPHERWKDGARFGYVAERFLWLLHTALRDGRSLEVAWTKQSVRDQIWTSAPPKNWMSHLMTVLRSLAKLRIGAWSDDGGEPPLSGAAPLFDRVNFDGHRLVVVASHEFLGNLRFEAKPAAGGPQLVGPSRQRLKQLRQRQEILDVYLPPLLGGTVECRILTARQKRLLQTIMGELTFPSSAATSRNGKRVARTRQDGEQVSGGLIKDFLGTGLCKCPDLNSKTKHVGFNGNGVRRGQGYFFDTLLTRAGYQRKETKAFLCDLKALQDQLGLVIGAVDSSNRWIDFHHLRRVALQNSTPGRQLQNCHVRIYAPSSFDESWQALFGWKAEDSMRARRASETRVLESLREFIASRHMTQNDVAKAIGVSKQYLSAILRGKPASTQAVKKAELYLARQAEAKPAATALPGFEVVKVDVAPGSQDAMKRAALAYRKRGWSVLPMKLDATKKKPHICWTKLQSALPTPEQIREWWSNWPDAGIAVALGRLSGLLCVDVDGEQAHLKLLEVLGEIPVAPTVKSGNTDPFRYHLYFRHPDFATKAKFTPWHQGLELRGHGGLAVLPPSLHSSGRRYAWVKGRTLEDVELPDPPQRILDALRAHVADKGSSTQLPGLPRTAVSTVVAGKNVSPRTAEFLRGKYAEESGWNDRIFAAACDMKARGFGLRKAMPMLLRGARPRSSEDVDLATATIKSAFSKPRKPGRR